MPNVYQGEGADNTYTPHAGSSSMGTLGKKKMVSRKPMGSAPPIVGTPRQNSPSGPRVLVSAAPGGVRRGAGALVGGTVGIGNAVQGENFYDAQGTNYKYHTAFALSVAFIIVFGLQAAAKTGIGGVTASEKTGNVVKDTLSGASAAASLKAWAVIAFVLVSAASFKSTESLAAAFSWLILISVILINGQQALKIFNGPLPAGTSTVKPVAGNNSNPTKL